MQAAEAFLKQSFSYSNTLTSTHLNQAKKPSIGNELLVDTSTSGSHTVKSQKAGKSGTKLAPDSILNHTHLQGRRESDVVHVQLALVKTVGIAHHAKICQNLGGRDVKSSAVN